MNFVELIAVAGTMASILGVFLAVHARYNNRLVKEESRHTREILNSQKEILARIEQGQEETRKEVAEARMDMAEARKEMAEAFRKMEEGHRETIKYLADLIRSEGDRTRQAIRGSPA